MEQPFITFSDLPDDAGVALREFTRVVRAITAGDLDQAMPLEVNGHRLCGPLLQLAERINRMRAQLSRLTAQAGRLTREAGACGELGLPHSDINALIRSLRETSRQNAGQHRLNTNLASLARRPQGQRSMAAVAHMVMAELAALLRMQRAMNGELTLCAGKPGAGGSLALSMPRQPSGYRRDAVPAAAPSPRLPALSGPQISNDRDSIAANDVVVPVISGDGALAAALEAARAHGYRGVISGRGSDGMDWLARMVSTAIVLDMRAPDMDGWQVLSRIKRSPDIRHVPLHVFLHRSLAGLDSARRERINQLYQGSGAPQQRVVLVVDDDIRNIFALTGVLERHGMEVWSAENGRGAIDMLHQRPGVGIVLMDTMMPDTDGFDAMRSIRRDQSFENLPIIAMTARAMKTDREKCLAAGASDYVSKPVDIEELLALMRRWLLRQGQETMTSHDSIASAELDAGHAPGSQAPYDAPVPVLVVDDNAAKRQAICAIISGMGLQATELASGRDALRLLLKQDFALILLDVRMPGTDGFETAALIHGRPRSAHTPVIFITAEAQSDVDRALGYSAGAVDYIGSPIVPEVLCAKVRVFADLFHTQRRLLMQTEELRRSKLLLQQLASHQEIIKEEERKRIAREIHDELGQNLLALRIDASMLHARTGTRHPRLNEKARLALNHIDTTIRSVRSIINDLRPPVLDLGLQAAIEWQVDDFQRRSGIVCAVRSQPPDFDRGMDERSATTLFRILQESLTNVLRHAGAHRVEVELGRDAGHFHMRIADDGVGLRPERMRDARSFGLQGMRERLRMVDGRLSIRSARGGGTELCVTIPAQFMTGAADNPRE